MTDGDRLPEDYGHILPPEKPRRFPNGVIIGIIIVIAFAGGLWYGYHRGVNETGPKGPPPLIKAAPGPIRVTPANPGGINIPNQKASIYDRMSGKGNQPTVEHLAPPPQQPMPGALPQGNGGQDNNGQAAANAAPAGAAPAGAASVNAGETPATPPPAALSTPPTKMPAPETTASPATKPQQPAKAAPAAKPAVPPKKSASAAATATGAVRAQIGAYRSVAVANAEWRRLVKIEPTLLRGLHPAIRRVDLGSRGVFQRLQTGPFRDVAAARRFCAALKAKGHGCFVVTR